MLSSCQLLAGIEELPSAVEHVCPDVTHIQSGPKLIEVHGSDGRCFFIDETEATRAEYATFLESQPQPSGDERCKWNRAFEAICPDSASEADCSGGDQDLPIACVDYCDAEAYCAWAGKSLCPVLHNASGVEWSSWYAACAGPDARPYPYGRTHDPTRCNGNDNPDADCGPTGCRLVSTSGALTDCATEEGVLHLSGNVEEWTAECNGRSSANDRCQVRGGSVDTRSITCAQSNARTRYFCGRYTGFRCCLTE